MLSSSKCSNYGDTENAAKAEGLVWKIQTQKCVTYLHFVWGFASDFTKNVH